MEIQSTMPMKERANIGLALSQILLAMYICSAQSRIRYNSGNRNSYFVAQSAMSYLAQDNSGIVSAQSENRDKVRLSRC